jgi:hypothetical protein
MRPLDLKLLKEASAFLSAAIKAASVNADTQAIVEAQSALARISSVLDRNPLP